jgi:hypothetical protein
VASWTGFIAAVAVAFRLCTAAALIFIVAFVAVTSEAAGLSRTAVVAIKLVLLAVALLVKGMAVGRASCLVLPFVTWIAVGAVGAAGATVAAGNEGVEAGGLVMRRLTCLSSSSASFRRFGRGIKTS